MKNAKKISKVIIENFQSHAKTEIDFGNFTAIVGPTDQGKSAIIRAISWCLFNDRLGDSFIRNGENQCSVRIIFDDDSEIIRTRGYRQNYYELIKNGEKILHLESFGSGAIEEVLNFHGMHPVRLFGDKKISLNICGQLEPPFFLTESSTTKAAIIGKLGGVDVVDTAIKSIGTQIRETKIKVKVLKSELKEVKSELKEIINLNQLEKSLDYLDKKNKEIKLMNSKISNIEDVYNVLNEKIIKHNELSKNLCCEDDITSSIKVIDLVEDQMREFQVIKEKVNHLSEAINEKTSLENITNISLEDVDSIILNCKKCEEIFNRSINISNVLNNYYKYLKQKIILDKTVSSEKDVILALSNIDNIASLLGTIEFIGENLNKYLHQKSRKNKGINIIEKLENKSKEISNDYKRELTKTGHCPLCLSKIDSDIEIEKML